MHYNGTYHRFKNENNDAFPSTYISDQTIRISTDASNYNEWYTADNIGYINIV